VWVERSYRAGLWIGAAVPLFTFLGTLLAATMVNYADERRAAGHIREALGRHALPGIVEQLLRRPHHLDREGERVTLTAMALRLDGFSAASETAKAKDVVRVLDELVVEVAEAVAAHHGQVDRVSGGTIVAYWGAPIPSESHAAAACQCALELRDRLGARAQEWKEKLGVEPLARLGLCTAEVVVGNLTGSRRARFAVFGAALEGAEHLAGATAQMKVSIFASEATVEAAREVVGARELDLVRVPGRARPWRAFELRALKADQPADDRAFCERFEQAVAAWRRREFKPALEAFEVLSKEHPSDGPTAVYVERCYGCLADPPGEDWDGVVTAGPTDKR
jgi:adenylate cyclase